VLDTRALRAEHPEWLPVDWVDHKPAAGETVTITLGAASGIPTTDAAAVVLDISADQSAAAGYVTVFPGDTARPNASNLNFAAGATSADLVVVPLGAGNTVNVFTNVSTHLIADVAGYFTSSSAAASGAGRFVPLPPARLVDTRTSGGKFAAGTTRTYGVLARGGVPATGVEAILANLTATRTAGTGWLTWFPAGQPRPTASNLNWNTAGATVANTASGGLGSGGQISVYAAATTDVIIDVNGYFTSG
jgi:hypothetical protein